MEKHKGEMYFGINDKIVQDCLSSLDSLGKIKPLVVGGLAIQLHASEREKILRKTADVDLLALNNEDFEHFKKNIYPIIHKDLRKRGYSPQMKRGRGNNAANVYKNPNKESQQKFLMHWTHFGPEQYKDFFDYVKRQLAFSQDVIYNSSKNSVRTASLEEILPLKIRRAIIYGGESKESLVGPLYTSYIDNAKKGNWGVLASVPLGSLGEGLLRMQEQLEKKGPYIRERFGTYKLSKDIYDLCLASRVISDNPNSFDKSRYEDNLVMIIEAGK